MLSRCSFISFTTWKWSKTYTASGPIWVYAWSVCVSTHISLRFGLTRQRLADWLWGRSRQGQRRRRTLSAHEATRITEKRIVADSIRFIISVYLWLFHKSNHVFSDDQQSIPKNMREKENTHEIKVKRLTSQPTFTLYKNIMTLSY